jgi:hypothetical protein
MNKEKIRVINETQKFEVKANFLLKKVSLTGALLKNIINNFIYLIISFDFYSLDPKGGELCGIGMKKRETFLEVL